jgi:RecA/RadA recombinase
MSNRAQTIMALLIIVVTAHCDTFGQGAIIRNQIRKNIEEKQGAAQKLMTTTSGTKILKAIHKQPLNFLKSNLIRKVKRKENELIK